MLGISEKIPVAWPKLVPVTLTIAVVTALSGGIDLASAQGIDVNESVSLRLTSTGAIKSPLQGFARLQLDIGELVGTNFRASAKVQSDGLVRNRFYAMWLTGPDGSRLLIDTARADEECEVDPDTGENEDCEVIVDLRSQLTKAPFEIITLAGLTINIREQVIGTESLAPVLATGTVPPTDREISTVTMRPPNVGTNIGSPFGAETSEIEDEDRRLEEEEEEQENRFLRKPPVVGTNFGSPFDEARRIEDEDRRLEEEEEAQGQGRDAS